MSREKKEKRKKHWICDSQAALRMNFQTNLSMASHKLQWKIFLSLYDVQHLCIVLSITCVLPFEYIKKANNRNNNERKRKKKIPHMREIERIERVKMMASFFFAHKNLPSIQSCTFSRAHTHRMFLAKLLSYSSRCYFVSYWQLGSRKYVVTIGLHAAISTIRYRCSSSTWTDWMHSHWATAWHEC